MQYGVVIFPTDQTIQPIELAVAAEERGFESLWFPEHSHIPASRATPWGGRQGAPPLPGEYWRTHDQMIALAAAAAATSQIRLATGITLLAQRDPIWFGKEVASLDTISNGRFVLGIGYGWNKEEMAQHGVVYSQRRALVREKVLAMKRMWADDEWSFAGEHVELEASWSWPKPVQKPHPPIILGAAAGPKTMAQIVEFCDGWMPLGGRHKLGESIELLHDTCRAAGRDPSEIELTYFYAKPEREAIDRLAAQGFTRVIFKLGDPDGGGAMPPGDVIAQLDTFAKLID